MFLFCHQAQNSCNAHNIAGSDIYMRCSILGGQKGKTKPGLSFPKIDEIFESDTWESAGVRREEEDRAEKFEREAGMVCGGMVR